MSCLPQRKRKRKSVSDGVTLTKQSNKRWKSCNIDVDNVIFNESNVDGFMELEELCDYTEDEIKAMTNEPRRKKRKKVPSAHTGMEFNQDVEIHDEELTLTSNEDEIKENKKVNDSLNICNDDTKEEKPPVSMGDLPPIPVIISKKERRKQARKLSFKLKLKERRKQYKEMKKRKVTDGIPIDEICDTIIKKSESFENKSNRRRNMSDWLGLGVPDEVMKSLSDCNFTNPTPIQRETLPHAIFYRQDIIGAAETGSGKTLAFGIPLIKNIMDLKASDKTKNEIDEDIEDGQEKPLYALVISPTRELALQINDHIETAAKYTDINCVAVVGGLAIAKQERLLSRCPEIVVGTPGRLHKLITNGGEHLNKFETLKYLVIDEADRMLEYGHFKELNDILDMISRIKVKRQIFVFSATLTLPQHHKSRTKGKGEKVNKTEMQLFIDKIGLNQKAKVIDLTTKHVTASSLKQLRVMCTNEEKEIYLAYFLMLHPGRTIVFVNSISCTRRLCSLLNLLGHNCLQLHSGKQQRQRLKYLDRFTSSENGILIATDVAARGLDIPKVNYVVHFQLPSDPKVYIHRSGRTARANESGLSFILEGPEDFGALKKISNVIKLGKDIPTLKVDGKILDGIKARVSLAREIDREEYKFRKENADNSWIKRAAKSMDIEVEETEDNILTNRQKSLLSAKRKQLKNLLNTDLYPTGFSGCYPTSGGNLVIPHLKKIGS